MKITPRTLPNISTEINSARFPICRTMQELQKTSGPAIMPTESFKDMSKLAVTFLKSYTLKEPKKHTSLNKFLDKLNILRYIVDTKFETLFHYPEKCITEVVKDKDKMLGGYILYLDDYNNDVIVDCLTLSKDLKKTKLGTKTIVNMAQRIYEIAKENNMNHVTWEVDPKNIDGIKLFNRLPQWQNHNGKQTASVYNFGEILKKYNL